MSALAYYKFIFITELLSAELMVSFRKSKRDHFVLRLTCFIALIYLLVFLFPLPEKIAYSGWYSSLMFLAFFILTMLFLKGIYVISWNNVLFIAIAAYTIKHFTYIIFTLIGVITNLYSIINMYSASFIAIADLDFSLVFYIMIYLFTYVFFYVVIYFIIGEKVNRQDDIKLEKTHLLFVSAFAILVDIVLNSFVVYEGGRTVGGKRHQLLLQYFVLFVGFLRTAQFA